MKRIHHSTRFGGICMTLFFSVLLWGMNSAQAFTVGKNYDAGNWQQVRDWLPPFMLNWVKEGKLTVSVVQGLSK